MTGMIAALYVERGGCYFGQSTRGTSLAMRARTPARGPAGDRGRNDKGHFEHLKRVG